MEISSAKPFLDLLAAETRRRNELLRASDPEHAYDQWMFKDLPFLHDLSLLFLVAIRHHIERRLLFLAACATDHGNPITRDETTEACENFKRCNWGKDGRLSKTG
jgi:hypothetical protein